MLIILIIFCILMLGIILIYFTTKKKVEGFLKTNFGTMNIKETIEMARLKDQETPKSLSGLESLILPDLKKDFPEMNIDELKRQVESYIITYLGMIESKEYEVIKSSSDKVRTIIKSYVDDLKNNNDNVKYTNIRVHRTVVNKYEKNNGFATLKFQTAIEYMYSKNNESPIKIQDRFLTELIYIIDADTVSTDANLLGLNCPNCGAPIKNLHEKYCTYCSTGVVDIARRTWYLNSLENK